MTDKNKFLIRDSFLGTIFSFLASFILYVIVVNISIFDPFEKAFEDFNFTDIYYAKELYENKISKDVVLVNIKHSGRVEIAEAINKIADQKPKVIGIDAIFKEKKEPFVDSILNAALHKSNKIVTAFFHKENGSITRSQKEFHTSKTHEGYVDFNLEGENNVVREFKGVNTEKDTVFAFATQIAMVSGYLDKNTAKQKLSEELTIKYTGNLNSFLVLDIDDVLAKDSIPALKNAIVIMGYLGDPTDNPYDIEDKLFTPLNPKYTGKSTPDMFGVLVHANIVKMLINKSFITVTPKYVCYILAFLVSFVFIMISLVLNKGNSVISHILIKILQLLFTVSTLYLALLLLKNDIIINVTPILVLVLLSGEMVSYFEHLLEYLKHKFQWKNYLDF
ncbi:sensor domain CHASE2-containing protein [Flavobacterium fluvii]|uniref:Sensor domain CHASE2-containing protein n=1 Tax=Flavobacterium fluvii TaxID=468056 RepID=A0A1M5HXT2_9FLAO|nr:CHASE2 domain-containing protein [Flavobacterium fluvii]SHG20796.1 sensor domain CHASE2-containing protein [Flavobacterium fluvii]